MLTTPIKKRTVELRGGRQTSLLHLPKAEVADTATAVNTDWAADLSGIEEAKLIGDAQKRGVISKQTEREELARRGVLGPTYDEHPEKQRICEDEEGLQPEHDIDPRTGLPINDSELTEGAAA